MPTLSLPTSASDTCALTVMVERSAMVTMVGVVWLAFSVWPSLAGLATMVPPIGAKILV
ncbi:hypothetical protein D3C87_1609020 [compost metagenome]